MTLTEFLLARINEDGVDAMTGWRWKSLPAGEYERLQARVLAECEAKRRIVELHYFMPGHDSIDFGFRDGNCVTCRAQGPCDTLKFLALPYANNPDYDEAWRP